MSAEQLAAELRILPSTLDDICRKLNISEPETGTAYAETDRQRIVEFVQNSRRSRQTSGDFPPSPGAAQVSPAFSPLENRTPEKSDPIPSSRSLPGKLARAILGLLVSLRMGLLTIRPAVADEKSSDESHHDPSPLAHSRLRQRLNETRQGYRAVRDDTRPLTLLGWLTQVVVQMLWIVLLVVRVLCYVILDGVRRLLKFVDRGVQFIVRKLVPHDQGASHLAEVDVPRWRKLIAGGLSTMGTLFRWSGGACRGLSTRLFRRTDSGQTETLGGLFGSVAPVALVVGLPLIALWGSRGSDPLTSPGARSVLRPTLLFEFYEPSQVQHLTFSPDGRWLVMTRSADVVAPSPSIRLGEVGVQIPGETLESKDLLYLVDTWTGKIAASKEVFGIFSVVFSPDSRTLAIGGRSSQILLLSAERSLEVIRKLEPLPAKGTTYLRYLDSDRLVTFLGNGRAAILDPHRGTLIETRTGPAKGARRITVPGHVDFMIDDLYVWWNTNAADRKPVWEAHDPNRVNPNSRNFLIADNSYPLPPLYSLVDLKTGNVEPLVSADAHLEELGRSDTSAERWNIITSRCSADGRVHCDLSRLPVRLWYRGREDQPCESVFHMSHMLNVAICPTGRRLATSDLFNSIRIWNLFGEENSLAELKRDEVLSLAALGAGRMETDFEIREDLTEPLRTAAHLWKHTNPEVRFATFSAMTVRDSRSDFERTVRDFLDRPLVEVKPEGLQDSADNGQWEVIDQILGRAAAQSIRAGRHDRTRAWSTKNLWQRLNAWNEINFTSRETKLVEFQSYRRPQHDAPLEEYVSEQFRRLRQESKFPMALKNVSGRSLKNVVLSNGYFIPEWPQEGTVFLLEFDSTIVENFTLWEEQAHQKLHFENTERYLFDLVDHYRNALVGRNWRHHPPTQPIDDKETVQRRISVRTARKAIAATLIESPGKTLQQISQNVTDQLLKPESGFPAVMGKWQKSRIWKTPDFAIDSAPTQLSILSTEVADGGFTFTGKLVNEHHDAWEVKGEMIPVNQFISGYQIRWTATTTTDRLPSFKPGSRPVPYSLSFNTYFLGDWMVGWAGKSDGIPILLEASHE